MGPNKFNKFREILSDTIYDTWDLVTNSMNQMNNNFNLAIKQFIEKYIKTTDFVDQQRYIINIHSHNRYVTEEIIIPLSPNILNYSQEQMEQILIKRTIKILFFKCNCLNINYHSYPVDMTSQILHIHMIG